MGRLGRTGDHKESRKTVEKGMSWSFCQELGTHYFALVGRDRRRYIHTTTKAPNKHGPSYTLTHFKF